MTTDHGRRDALKKLAAIATAPLWVEALASAAERDAVRHHAALAAASGDWTPQVLSADQDRAVTAFAEIIIPETDTPGATAAHVDRFIDLVLHDGDANERQHFLDGLAWLDAHCRETHGRGFADLDAPARLAVVTALAAPTPPPGAEPGAAFFTAMKALTVTGYYTSEVAMTKELGDDLNMFFTEFKGCTHPEHQS